MNGSKGIPKASPIEFRFGVPKYFQDSPTVERLEMSKLFGAILPFQNLGKPLDNSVFHQVGQGVERFRIDDETQRILKEASFQIQLAKRPPSRVEWSRVCKLRSETGSADDGSGQRRGIHEQH